MREREGEEEEGNINSAENARKGVWKSFKNEVFFFHAAKFPCMIASTKTGNYSSYTKAAAGRCSHNDRG